VSATDDGSSSGCSDRHTPLGELRQLVDQFVSQRDWHQFHAPKNLTMALAVEAAELMEHFQWMDGEDSRALDDERQRQLVSEEMADVLAYLCALANQLDIDLSATLAGKMAKNAAKYPVDEYRGRAGGDQKHRRRD
jgi:dCTP diphosphatase